MRIKSFIPVLLLTWMCSILVFAQKTPRSNKWDRDKRLRIHHDKIHPFLEKPTDLFSSSPQHSIQKEISTLHAIIPDFQVNENAGPVGATQNSPQSSTDALGNFILVWSDSRNGDLDIYAQRYKSDGSKIGCNFKVNDDWVCGYQNWPDVAMDAQGNFIVTWMDARTGYPDIYIQQYDHEGKRIGMNRKVNDGLSGSIQRFPTIDTDREGNFIITWVKGGYPSDNIYVQRFSHDGYKLGTNFRVNEEASEYIWSSSIAVANNGSFIITWIDYRNDYRGDVYAQRFSSYGTALNPNFKVNDDIGNQSQIGPSICVDSSGSFIITWIDERNNYRGDVYAQRFTIDGTAIGANFEVNDDQDDNEQSSSTISSDGNGNFVITWRDYRNNYRGNIYAQCFSNDGTALGSNFQVSEDNKYESQYSPSVSSDMKGNFIITWENYNRQIIDSNIYVKRYDHHGTPFENCIKVNDDQGSADQMVPSIATDENGDFIMAWTDYRDGISNIYAQNYTCDGLPVGDNFKVNEGNSSSDCPSVSSNSRGDFVIAWESYQNEILGIYAQRLQNDGILIGSNFKVNDYLMSYPEQPAVCVDEQGNFIITWHDERNNYRGDVYAQRYSDDGTPLGDNFIVNDDEGDAEQSSASISSDPYGKFVITWQDYRKGYSDIYCQLVHSDGTLIGANFKVNDNESWCYHHSPSVSTDGIGNFVIAWQDGRHWDDYIYAQRYNRNGDAIGANFLVSSDIYIDQWNPSISLNNNGNFIITWCDGNDTDMNIFGQRFRKGGSKVGKPFRLTSTRMKNQFSSEVKLLRNRIFCTWTDNRAGGTGYDIWANVLDWNSPEMNVFEQITSCYLKQNYPNPFNSSTEISYNIFKPGVVTLKVYDLLGKQIQTLVNEYRDEGIYFVNFDASNLSSGVYLYKLKLGNNTVVTKKMLYIQ